MKKHLKLFKNIIFIISLLIYIYLVFIGRNQYLYNMSYSMCILLIALICLVIFTYGIISNKEMDFKNNVNLYIVLYLTLLISVVFFIGRSEIKLYSWWYSGQYTPFNTIRQQLSYGSALSIIKNIIGNSIMLMPLTLLLMLKNKKYNNLLKQLIIILPIIIGIELFQAFTHTGSFDIDDIILNYLGTVIFTFLITRLSIINKIKKLFYTDFKIKESLKYILFYFSTFLLVAFITLIFLNSLELLKSSIINLLIFNILWR